MKKKVLVYDNQLGYYELLNETLKSGSYDFRLFNNGYDYTDGYDAVVFFLHDEIEFLDLVKLYNPKMPFVLGSSKKSNNGVIDNANMFTVDLNLTKDGIEQEFKEVFDVIA